MGSDFERTQAARMRTRSPCGGRMRHTSRPRAIARARGVADVQPESLA
jgi:hypothetical protein